MRRDALLQFGCSLADMDRVGGSMSKNEPRKNQAVDTGAIKKRFLLLNKERLRRAEDCMRTNQRDFLDFLPLLFHINHPRLPGYVAKEIPSGICDYAPSERALTAANRYINRFEYKKRAMARYDILSMFLMGSSGTIAYSKKSDFDIWLCHQHGLTSDQLGELQSKATSIEQWADEQGLEVHFFLMDADDFKQGKIVDLSSESSGSAQ
jgi:adenylate cyclase, class 1